MTVGFSLQKIIINRISLISLDSQLSNNYYTQLIKFKKAADLILPKILISIALFLTYSIIYL